MRKKRWLALMEAWGFGSGEEVYESLVTAYSQKHRHYHDGEHVEACLGWLDHVLTLSDAESSDPKSTVEKPEEVELAIWFHDAVYNPFASDNERKSADWAMEFLTAQGAGEAAMARVDGLIMATLHNAPPATRDESILIDIDLAVLGSDPATYAAFEKAVRKEYRFVPFFLYRKKRSEILQGFLERPVIYRHELLRAAWEQQARKNLAAAIADLSPR